LQGLPAVAGAVRHLILEIVSQTATCHSESRRLSRRVRNLLFNTDQTSLPTQLIAYRPALSFRPKQDDAFSAQRRNLSSIDRASHVGSSLSLGNHTNRSLGAPPFHPILPQLRLQTIPAQASSFLPGF
jgi:hypothetical protein